MDAVPQITSRELLEEADKRFKEKGGWYARFDPDVHPQTAKVLCENYGFNDLEIAEVLGISPRTLYYWKSKYPEFEEAIAAGKAACDGEIKQALIREMQGYFVTEEVVLEDGSVGTKQVWCRGNTAAARWWLERRQPQEFGKLAEDEAFGGDRQKELGGILAAMMERMRDDAVSRRKLTAIPVEAVEVVREPNEA